MSSRRTYEATLRLTTVDDLFGPPDLSPLSPDYDVHSDGPALQYIADEINANGSYRNVRASFELPASELESNSKLDVEDAVRRWAATRLRGVQHDVAATRLRGLRSLVAGLLLFAVLISLSRVLGQDGDGVDDTISKGLEIAAWVALWFPLDTLVFTVWQLRLDRRAFRIVGDMELSLTADPDRSS